MEVITSNSKTYKSLDLSTNCPKRQAGHPCSYCYVEAERTRGFRAKTVQDRIPYNHEILRLKSTTRNRMNKTGGLRIFSFGDYLPWMDDDLNKIFDDADSVGLKVKAITKVPAFVYKYHDRCSVINISVDSLGEGVDLELAKKLKQQYNNIMIRSAIMSMEDLETLSWTDIYTLNHVHNKYHYFTPTEKAEIAKKYPNKLCCITGRCETCSIKCGATI